MMPWYIIVLLVWHIFGGLFLLIVWVNKLRPCDDNNLLSPVWIYDEWELNYFGTGVVCLIFNLLCPIFSVFWWSCKFIKFICTVGRR